MVEATGSHLHSGERGKGGEICLQLLASRSDHPPGHIWILRRQLPPRSQLRIHFSREPDVSRLLCQLVQLVPHVAQVVSLEAGSVHSDGNLPWSDQGIAPNLAGSSNDRRLFPPTGLLSLPPHGLLLAALRKFIP